MNTELMFKLSALSLDYFKLSEINLLMLDRLFTGRLVVKSNKPLIRWSKRTWLIQDLFKVSIINKKYFEINNNYYKFNTYISLSKQEGKYKCFCSGLHLNINKGSMLYPSLELIILEPAEEINV